jgi:hypothetical protein
MLTILTILYETCCTGWRPKEQKIVNRILQDMEDLAEEEVERLLNHLMLKRKTSCAVVAKEYLNIHI